MASLFRTVFGCCLRGQDVAYQGSPDENTPFIAPADDDLPPPRNYTIDHQKMKERLGHIVRSKEGKMVNVSHKLPFNMHNRPTYGRQDRSLSANTTPPRPTSSTSQTNPSPESPSTSAFPHMSNGRAYADSRDPSPSIQTSRSTSSLHPGDASYLPPEVDPDGGVRRPILNLRMVRGSGGFTTGGRVGRSMVRGRRGRFEDERGGSSAEEGPDGKGKHVENGADEVLEVESPSTPGAMSPDDGTAGITPTSPTADGREAAQARRAALLAAQFKIEDVGSISQSWGE